MRPHILGALIVGAVLSTVVGMSISACRRSARRQIYVDRGAGLTGGKLIFSDDFSTLRPDWKQSGANWTIVNGELHCPRDFNKGIWLQTRLPRKVRIEFTVRSETPPKDLGCNRDRSGAGGKKVMFQGDIKFELFNVQPRNETGYVFIYGGYQNTIMRIVRGKEHNNPHLVSLSSREYEKRKLVPGKRYRMKIVRTDSAVRWYIGGESKAVLSYLDNQPIRGSYLGFNNWCAHLFFDELKIYELE